ncbi:cell wall biosynthesis glycosyltransferase [Streptococcus varani]|uniref:Cell wall biosynthesis glycosyltransferase n=1 Tax=Streptococcus varani TaxID=1608583 RepID=A0A0E4CSG5_9STRE|nr:glycosyltransferase [Streptococcus varani]CQR24517.1 cell wall biosynthesis glycosyltransferase [Streptococcus varani]
MKKVAVILSTYNGEKYLREQMESLLSQTNVDITLFVRDDGSKDRTEDILLEYSNRINILLYKEKNLGFERSFMEAVLKTQGSTFDYYAFCDQDDIWYADKLSTGIDYIESKGNSQPFLYCSNQQIIDEEGHFVRDEEDKQDTISKQSSLFALNQRGCVMIWNDLLHLHLVDSYQMIRKSDFIPAHDTWITVLAYAVGQVYIDNAKTMGYRVSTHNTAGSYIGLAGRIKYVWKKLGTVYNKRKHQRAQISHLLLSYLESLPESDSAYIRTFLDAQTSFFKAAGFVFSSKPYFRGMSKKWVYLTKFLILFRRI